MFCTHNAPLVKRWWKCRDVCVELLSHSERSKRAKWHGKVKKLKAFLFWAVSSVQQRLEFNSVVSVSRDLFQMITGCVECGCFDILLHI
jgi:hypothetical protein